MPIITDLSPPQTAEGLILGAGGATPLNLGNAGSLQLSALVIPPPAKRPEWASNGDVDGAELVRDPLHDNRDCSFKVRAMDGTMDQAVAAIKLLEDKLQEACALGANGGAGLAFLWTPAHATVGLTGYMVFAQITDMPITYDDGWFAQHPVLTVAFTAKPFLYGAEVTGPTATGATPVLTVAVPSVPGDVPAEARLVITDGSTQARRWVEWGVEQRYYNAGTPSSLLIDSEDLVTTGFAGVQQVYVGETDYRRAGATHDAVTAALFSQPIALCGTGDQPHIGTFRVKGRVRNASAATSYWRLTWKTGDGPLTSNAWVQPAVDASWNEIDFGLVTVEQLAVGTQKWSGRIDVYSTIAGGDTADIDYLALFPVNEGYGRLEASYAYRPGVTTGHDEFTGTTAGSALNARAAPAGGTWATSGATTDFAFADNTFSSGSEEVKRTTVSDSGFRWAILGSSALTDTEVGVDILANPVTDVLDFCLIARWTDANNHLRLRWTPQKTIATTGALALETVVTGTATRIAVSPTLAVSGGSHGWKMRLIAYAGGRALAWLLDTNGNTVFAFDVLNTLLATGGTLASGPAGFADRHVGTIPSVIRAFDNFYVAAPAAEPLIINSGRSLQVRSDSNLRLSSDGTTYGDIASRGSRLFIPQAGDAGRTSRIAVRAAREDVITNASRNDGDSITLATFYTPRYLAVPR